MSVNEAKTAILNNKTALGIEFGSTRIKAVLVDENIIRSHPEVMSGKTVTKTVCGLTLWMTFIRDYREVTATW